MTALARSYDDTPSKECRLFWNDCRKLASNRSDITEFNSHKFIPLRLDDARAFTLSESIKSNTCLQRLILRIHHLSLESFGVCSLLRYVGNSTSLQHLQLCGKSSRPGNSSTELTNAFLEAAAVHGRLQTLDLRFTEFGASSLAKVLSSPHCQLTELSLCHGWCHSEESDPLYLQEVAQAFAENRSLRKLTLKGNFFDSLLTLLLRKEAEQPRLTHLDLSGMVLSRSSVSAIENLLQRSGTLESLSLLNSRSDTADLFREAGPLVDASFLSAVDANRSLLEVSLSGHWIADAHIRQLAFYCLRNRYMAVVSETAFPSSLMPNILHRALNKHEMAASAIYACLRQRPDLLH